MIQSDPWEEALQENKERKKERTNENNTRKKNEIEWNEIFLDFPLWLLIGFQFELVLIKQLGQGGGESERWVWHFDEMLLCSFVATSTDLCNLFTGWQCSTFDVFQDAVDIVV